MNTIENSNHNPVTQHQTWWLAISITVLLAAIPNPDAQNAGAFAYIGRVIGLALPGFLLAGLAWAIRAAIGKPMTAIQFVRFFTGITIGCCVLFLLRFALD